MALGYESVFQEKVWDFSRLRYLNHEITRGHQKLRLGTYPTFRNWGEKEELVKKVEKE
jgi:hypothetical protein